MKNAVLILISIMIAGLLIFFLNRSRENKTLEQLSQLPILEPLDENKNVTDRPPVMSLSSSSKTVIEGNTAFALDLYKVLQPEPGNLFYSPYSISTALALTYTGARGETERELAKALHFSLAHKELSGTFNDLAAALENQQHEGLELSIANALWGQQDYTFLPEFLTALEKDYGSSLRHQDFKTDPEGARQTINTWVEEQTKERIKDLIPQDGITEFTRLVLTNAIYFNAKWQTPFNASATSEKPFYLLDGTKTNVPMMHMQNQIAYTTGEGYQAISLPYVGGNLSFVAIVPDTGQFETVETKLSTEFMNDLQALNPREIILNLPKFEFESAFELSKAMNTLGVRTAFAGSEDCSTESQYADFSGMDGTRCLYISYIFHKAFVKVEEEGTEAAAATGVIETVATSAPPAPIELTIDRPFIFFIRDQQTGSILFLGRVLNPLGNN
jgi:serpin B